MFERIIEIIVFVIGELNRNKDISDIDVKKLKDLGYTTSEISTAFSWLVDRVEFSEELFREEAETGPKSFRVLHEAEEELFSKDAWGELIQLQRLGVIDNQTIEIIIERAMMSGNKVVSSKLLNNILANVLFSPIENSTRGNRIMLKGNDTIN
jgi:uncharacterized protein Smg (DUF494 family)